MAKPQEYLGQVSSPIKPLPTISGVPDTSAYAAGDVLYRNAAGEAFLLPCAALGKGGLSDICYAVVREKAVGGAVVKANLRYIFTRIGGTAWAPPAANAAFSGPTDMEDVIGYIDVVTADYEEFKVSGATAYAIAFVPIPESVRALLVADDDVTDYYVTPTILSGTPTFPAASLITTNFIAQQH